MPAATFLVAGNPGQRSSGEDPLLSAILARIGLERPRVAYIGAASNDNRLFFLWVAAMLKKAGAGPVSLVPLAARKTNQGKVRSLMEQADVVFVSGGDVEQGMRVLERTGITSVLVELHRAGKPFIGLSAGSIMLAESWVRWADSEDDRTAEIFPCLGLAPLLCDTHGEEEEWEELKVLLRLTGAPVGYGIPAGAALKISAAGVPTALGKPIQRLKPNDGGVRKVADLKLD